MEKEQINQLLDKQRQYFYSGATLNLDFRISALKRLRASIQKHEHQIHAALKKDLGKSNFESYMCETGLVLSEITHMLKNIRSYAELCTTVSPYNSTFAYHEAYDLYLLQGKVSTDAQWAIDHVMLSGTLPQVHLYTVADDPLACTASDHLPHFADVTLQTPPPVFEEGDPNDLTTVDFADLFQ